MVELVTAYLDDTLDPETRARFEVHLMECDGCESYIQQFRVTVRTVGEIGVDDIDPAFRNRLLAAFRDWNQDKV